MLRKICLVMIIYPLAAALFAFSFWGESRIISRAAESSQAVIVAPAGDPARSYHRSRRLLLPGTAHETALYVVTAPAEGPVVLVIGGIHGDEPAGYLAAEAVATWVVDRGTLIVIPRAHIPAIRRRQRNGEDLLDLNRSFPGNASGSPTERLAAAIYGVMLEFEPDWVIDLHEALFFERLRPGALGQTLIYPPQGSSTDVVEQLLVKVNSTIRAPANHFLLLRGLLRGTVLSAAVSVGAESIMVETCKQLPLDERVQQQRQAVLSLLYLLGITVY